MFPRFRLSTYIYNHHKHELDYIYIYVYQSSYAPVFAYILRGSSKERENTLSPACELESREHTDRRASRRLQIYFRSNSINPVPLAAMSLTPTVFVLGPRRPVYIDSARERAVMINFICELKLKRSAELAHSCERLRERNFAFGNSN